MIANIQKGKYKIYGAIFGFLALMVLSFIFAVFPVIRGIVFNSDEIQRKKIDNEINQQGISKIPEMEKMSEIFKQKAGNLEIILENGGEVGFLKKIEDLAEETGNKVEIKIVSDKNVPIKKEKGSETKIMGSLPYDKYILLEVTILGNYDGLLKFLNKLEKNDKLVNVIGLDVSKLEVEAEIPNIFSSVNKSVTNPPVLTKKEVLQSVINLAVYLKK